MDALFALRLLKNPTRQWEEMFDQQPAPVYDDDRFDGTRDLVTARLRSQGIRVWVLYNAHLLDSRAMEHILGTWKECDKQFSVMLIGKSSPIDVEQHVLKDQMDSQPSLKFYKAPQIELRRVGEDEFCTEVLDAMFKDLRAGYSSEIEQDPECVMGPAWEFTKGHWGALQRLVTEFDSEHGQKSGRRTITKHIAKEVFARLLPPVTTDD